MERRTAQFISALRASGVRISLAESADAFQALVRMGAQDREQFRISLRATLIKDARDLPVFERLFPLFFRSSEPPPMQDAAEGLTPQEARQLAEALRQFTGRLREMMQKLLQGEPLSPAELNQLDQIFHTNQRLDLRDQNWLSRQMEQALQFNEVRQALEELLKQLQAMGMNRRKIDQLRRGLQANLQAMQQQVRRQAGESILQRMAENPREQPSDGLLQRPFQAITPQEMHQLRKEVRRLAAALRTRLALRLRRAKGGQLDSKATLRAGLKYGHVPLELRFRDHSLKPKLVVICDISTSMRFCSELMLSLLYAIQDQISNTHAFVFINRLVYISPGFAQLDAEQAIEQVLQRMPPGYYNTNLGQALVDFQNQYLHTLDSRTTMILVGDGRNNYNDPRTAELQRLARRSRGLIWLNPEPIWLWGSGDSDMPKYAPYCQRIFQVSNLMQLAEAVDQMLTH